MVSGGGICKGSENNLPLLHPLHSMYAYVGVLYHECLCDCKAMHTCTYASMPCSQWLEAACTMHIPTLPSNQPIGRSLLLLFRSYWRANQGTENLFYFHPQANFCISAIIASYCTGIERNQIALFRPGIITT